MTRAEKFESYRAIRDVENESRNRNVQNANNTEGRLGSQLITLSVLFLTISVVVLGNDVILSDLSCLAKWLILLVFITVVISIACGIKYMFVSSSYFERNSRIHHENYEQLRNDILNGDVPDFDTINARGTQQQFKSQDNWLKIQIGFLGFGASLCTILLVVLLFGN